jgi:hypothetical protein
MAPYLTQDCSFRNSLLSPPPGEGSPRRLALDERFLPVKLKALGTRKTHMCACMCSHSFTLSIHTCISKPRRSHTGTHRQQHTFMQVHTCTQDTQALHTHTHTCPGIMVCL